MLNKRSEAPKKPETDCIYSLKGAMLGWGGSSEKGWAFNPQRWKKKKS
jgi:hypothetical protein